MQQKSEMDCGAACLKMVAQYHSRYFSLAYLKELTSFREEGVSLLDISEAAEQIGLRTLAARIRFQQLRDDVPLPSIVHWENNHFVVVYEVSRNKVTLADPAIGIQTISRQEFEAGFYQASEQEEGVALLLETTPAFFEREEEEPRKNGFRYYYRHLLRFRSLTIQLLLGLFFGSILQFVIPFLIMATVDVGINNQDVSFLWIIFLAISILFISQTSVELIRAWILNRLGMHFNINLLTDFLLKMIRLPMRFFESHTYGDLMQRIGDNERLERFLTSSALFSFLSMVNILLFSVILLAFSPLLFAVFLTGALLYLLWVRIFLQRRRKLDFRRFEQAAVSHNYLFDLIQGMQDIQLYNAGRQRRWAWEKIQARLFRLSMRSLTVELWQSRGAFFIHEITNFLLIILAARAVVGGEMTLGMMMATLYILGQLNGPLNHLVEFAQSAQAATISMERMQEIEELSQPGEPAGQVSQIPEGADIQVAELTFRYGGSGAPAVLNGVNMHIPDGSISALIGSNGSGKTTLIKLLIGIYQPDGGRIEIGDHPLSGIKPQAWRNRIAAVLHEGHIFNDSLARNIALADESVDSRKLAEAVRIAHLQEYIEHLPEGAQTLIGEGGFGLNVGLKQQILIARAVYKQPDFLFLDEATNGLDAFQEMVIMENLKEAFRGKTLVIVANRLSTVLYADVIHVLERGELIETGTHASLLARKGAYFHLVKRQMELGAG